MNMQQTKKAASRQAKGIKKR